MMFFYLFTHIYISILEPKETRNKLTRQTSKHSTVSHEINVFSKFLETICENFNNNEISQKVEQDLRKILAWFIIDYFVHNIDFIAQSRKNLSIMKRR